MTSEASHPGLDPTYLSITGSIDDYLLGKRNSYWPIPNVDEATNSMRILDTVEKIIDNVSANNP